MSDLSQEWMEKLTDWRNSGLSMAAWCRQNAESYHRFIYWRDRLEPKSPTLAGNFVEFPIGVRFFQLTPNAPNGVI